jgi:hypothetical protein
VLRLCVLALAMTMLGCGNHEDTPTVQGNKRQQCLPAKLQQRERGISITNNGAEPWTEIQLTLNEAETPEGGTQPGFTAEIERIRPGETETVPFENIMRNDGLRFDPKAYAVTRIELHANEGMYSRLACDPEARKELLDRLEKMAGEK